MVIRSDGAPVHFSIGHALKPMPRARWFGIPARDVVRPHIIAYRDAYFAWAAGPDGRAPCEATGALVTPEVADRHHADAPFAAIVRAFLEARGLDPARGDYVGTTEGAPVLALRDRPLADDFAGYHAAHAVLRVVDRAAHRRRAARPRAGRG